jgi:hypothetical protein
MDSWAKWGVRICDYITKSCTRGPRCGSNEARGEIKGMLSLRKQDQIGCYGSTLVLLSVAVLCDVCVQ